MCIDTDMLWQWLVATAEFQHSIVYYATDQCWKDWKHVLMQMVVTLNTCCDTACLTFQLPHITISSSQAIDDNTQLASRGSNVWKNGTNLQSDEKVLQFRSSCGDSFRWGGQVDYSLFSSEINRPTRVVPDQRPLNGRCCCCSSEIM